MAGRLNGTVVSLHYSRQTLLVVRVCFDGDLMMRVHAWPGLGVGWGLSWQGRAAGCCRPCFPRRASKQQAAARTGRDSPFPADDRPRAPHLPLQPASKQSRAPTQTAWTPAGRPIPHSTRRGCACIDDGRRRHLRSITLYPSNQQQRRPGSHPPALAATIATASASCS